MRVLTVWLLASTQALPLVAQDVDRAGALVAAIEYTIARSSSVDRTTLVLDTVRTVPGRTGRQELLREIATQIGARPGRIEDHCFRIPKTRPTDLKRTEVRNASMVVAPHFLALQPDVATVRVRVWHGEGIHTGFTLTLLLHRRAGEWLVADHPTSSTGVCILPESARNDTIAPKRHVITL